jgi:hypothetical protein
VLVTLGVLVFGAIQAAAIVQSSLRPPAEQAPPAVERWPL